MRLYLPHVGEAVHDQAVVAVLVIVQLQHGAAVLVQEEALGTLVSRVKRVHNYGFCAFDLTATKGAPLTIRLLEESMKTSFVFRMMTSPRQYLYPPIPPLPPSHRG